ncbi:MAG: thermonuclease family protein, partial [Rhodospirillales bacterium]|nr:thermonuclease family protein [Rhodospirillales bacterium]
LLGIWRGEFVLPWEWQEGKRLPSEPGDVVQVCDIKGTIDDKGRRTFYTPLNEQYDAVQVDPSKGERMFCSDDEARLAGWRGRGRQ